MKPKKYATEQIEEARKRLDKSSRGSDEEYYYNLLEETTYTKLPEVIMYYNFYDKRYYIYLDKDYVYDTTDQLDAFREYNEQCENPKYDKYKEMGCVKKYTKSEYECLVAFEKWCNEIGIKYKNNNGEWLLFEEFKEELGKVFG